MVFSAGGDAYNRFMGRYSEPLSARFADLAGVHAGQRALDVGCGPGALTAELVRRLGTGAVAAADPSRSFAAAVTARLPGVDVRLAAAERLPFGDREFDVTLAQLVVHFMADPVTGLAEMGRVTRPGGMVAACVWDHAGGGGPLATFWRAVHQLDPAATDESGLAGARVGQLAELSGQAGLATVHQHSISVTVTHPTFGDWWDPFTLGIGPAGAYVASLAADRRELLRGRCHQLLGPGPIRIRAGAWAVTCRPGQR